MMSVSLKKGLLFETGFNLNCLNFWQDAILMQRRDNNVSV